MIQVGMIQTGENRGGNDSKLQHFILLHFQRCYLELLASDIEVFQYKDQDVSKFAPQAIEFPLRQISQEILPFA
jgi:hypothetical protein